MTISDKGPSQKTVQSTNFDFTHTAFIEEGTTTWCPNCPNAAEALYFLYNNSEYPFYFVGILILVRGSVANATLFFAYGLLIYLSRLLLARRR